MASINGYQYITEEEAQNAVTLCNQHYGIPKSPTDITQNWCEYFYAELNNPVFIPPGIWDLNLYCNRNAGTDVAYQYRLYGYN
jgi:hypothetical protein